MMELRLLHRSIQDAWREGLTYLNELSSEGLLSANIFTDDGQQFKAILNQETPIVGLTTAGSLSNWPDVKNNKNFAEMEMIEPLKGPEGVQYTPYNPYTPGQEMYIIEGTDKLDLALKFADEFFNIDTGLIERFGEEGVDWTRDPKDLEGQTNAYVEADFMISCLCLLFPRSGLITRARLGETTDQDMQVLRWATPFMIILLEISLM